MRQDAPKRASRRPKTPPRRPKMPPRGAKTPQDPENRAKMEPSWHPNRSKWKGICENLKISQIVLSLQRGLDFRGFEVSFSDVKSMVFRRFLREASPRRPKKLPRRPRTPPRRPETPPRRAQDAPRRPRSTARRPKTPSRRGPGRARSGKNWARFGIEKRSPADPPPKLDF